LWQPDRNRPIELAIREAVVDRRLKDDQLTASRCRLGGLQLSLLRVLDARVALRDPPGGVGLTHALADVGCIDPWLDELAVLRLPSIERQQVLDRDVGLVDALRRWCVEFRVFGEHISDQHLGRIALGGCRGVLLRYVLCELFLRRLEIVKARSRAAFNRSVSDDPSRLPLSG
jgi:hypothetical protein